MGARPASLSSRLAATIALGLAAAALSGCGSSRSAGAAVDPALVVPAAAPVYAEARVRPTGALQANARALGQAISREGNPYARLLGALQTPGSPALDYGRDVAPWLGERAAIFLLSYSHASESRLLALLRTGLPGGSGEGGAFPFAGAGSPQGAIVLDARDERRARTFLTAQAAHAGARPRSYRTITYQAAGGVAFGLVRHLAVIGSEAAMHAVIDTSAGAPALARAGAYSHLLSLAPPGALGHLYVDGTALSSSSAAKRAKQAPDLLALLAGARKLNASLVPSRGALTLDFDSSPASATAGGLLRAEADAARAVGELPGDSFFAAGFGAAAPALGRFAQALALLGGGSGPAAPGGISVRGLLGGLQAPLSALTAGSADAKRDFQSWMGSGGVFAAGTGLLDLKAALVIASRNPALSRAAVAKLGDKLRKAGGSISPASVPGTDAALTAQMPGLPVALVIANGRDAQGQTKFAVAIGEASLAAALNPQSSFSGSAVYSSASSALGEGILPSLAVQVPTLLGLLEGVGLSEDATLAPILPLLRPLDAVYGGGRGLGGDAERFRVRIGLRGG
jgi:hypothetical protein